MAVYQATGNPTSADVTRILELFRSRQMTAPELHQSLRGVGYTSELANYVMQNEIANLPPDRAQQGGTGSGFSEAGDFGSLVPSGGGSTTRPTSADLTRILNLFRSTPVGDPATERALRQALYDDLRFRIGYDEALARHTVENEMQSRIPATPALTGGDIAGRLDVSGGGRVGGPGTTVGGGAPGGGGPTGVAGEFQASDDLTKALTDGAGGPVGGSGFPGTGVGGVGSRTREEALADQDFEGAAGRVGRELFGPANTLQRRILNQLIKRYAQFQPITEFGTQDPDTAANQYESGFRRFAGASRPSGIQLGNQLANIFATATPEALETGFGPREENEEVSFADIDRAVNVGITPFVQRLSPFVRSQAARVLERKFRDLFAQNPEQFPDTASVFRELQRRNYLPTAASPWGR